MYLLRAPLMFGIPSGSGPTRFPPEARQTDSSSDAVAAHIIFHSPNDACSSNTRSTKFKLSIHQFFCSIAGGIPPPKNAR